MSHLSTYVVCEHGESAYSVILPVSGKNAARCVVCGLRGVTVTALVKTCNRRARTVNDNAPHTWMDGERLCYCDGDHVIYARNR